MMSKTARGLFGGALLAAGLTAPAADAQQFQIGYTAAHAYAAASPYFNSAYQYGNGPFILSPTASNNYGDFASAYMNFGPGGMGASVTAAASYGYTFAHSHNFISYFTVDKPFQSTITWDFSGAGAFYTNYLQIDDITNGGTLFFDQSYNSGTTQISLNPNTQYVVFGLVDVGVFPGDKTTSWWNATVPTPGSASILALAGLSASRRRRALR